MRDDIHNKAPISHSLRRLLRHALLPADQGRPDMLEDLAVTALSRDLQPQLTGPLLSSLREDAVSPPLFPRVANDGSANTRLQADVIAHMNAGATSVAEAVSRAVDGYIESICNESQAAMIAAGGTRRETIPAVDAFRHALHQAVPRVIETWAGFGVIDLPSHRVTLEEPLPLAKVVRKREPAN